MRTQNELDEQLCKIITFNGQGCSGKTTQSKLLIESDDWKYKCIHSYKLRRIFRKEIYNELGRKRTRIKYPDSDAPDQTLYEVEVLGIPTLAWLTAQFYKEVKPLQQEDYILVLDHYIGDFYADMLAGVDIEKFQSFVREHLAIPDFNQGIHFYLDINDHKIYQKRWRKREEKKPPKERREPPVTLKIFEERRERYQKLCELTPLICINATGVSKDKVAEKVAKEIEKKWSQ